jgi:glycosyltransferase involved in cell wall biosynthesis
MNDLKKITVIIPFANEGCEVENTLMSIFQHSDNNINIIAINDASDDGFDYTGIAEKFNITYIENSQRLGVAASRELGISLCETEYFLLLDAHMRFYDDKWIDRITEELSKDPRALLCAQTKILKKKKGIVIEEETPLYHKYYGAIINYFYSLSFLEPEWVTIEPDFSTESTVSVSCVLGAAYACSKKYWRYLRGVEGLLSYGNDEVLISLKVWLEGGTCKLLNDVVIGHIYRDAPPYAHFSEKRTYNRLYIAYLLLPIALRKKTFAIEKFKSPETYLQSSLLFYENYEFIKTMKSDLESKFTKDFISFDKLNREKKYKEKETIKHKERILLNRISYIVCHIDQSKGIGLMTGKMGIALLLFHYAKFSLNPFFSQLAKSLLDNVVDAVSENIPLNFADGLLGIGWGINYLSLHKFIKGDVNEILSDLDLKVMEISPRRINRYDLFYGFGGIVRYIMCRLYFENRRNKDNNLFSPDFLLEVYKKSKEIIETGKYNSCPETYIEYILYYENRKEIDPPSVYDITVLPDWNEYSKRNKDLSLTGVIGFCLEFIAYQSINYNI